MTKSDRRPPWVSVVFLLFIGASAIATGFWLVDHRQAVPNSMVVIAALAFVFFVTYTWALLRYLHWRDQSRAGVIGVPYHSDPNLAGTVYGLIPEREYDVIKSFTDYYGNSFQQGERLRFKQRHFLPYHGGHTIVFEERSIFLQEDQNREILDNFSHYIALIER